MSIININKQSNQLDALTSLRFFAAMAVVLFHVQFVLPLSYGGMVAPWGVVGVNFFFILSGFILTYVYGNRSKPIKKLDFYKKRAARILPLHYVTLLVWVWLFYKLWTVDPEQKMWSGLANLSLLHAFYPSELFNLGFNAVSWSISVEAFFYLVFPFIIYRSRSIFIFMLYLVVMLGMPGYAVDGINHYFPGFFYFNPLARLMEFSAGIVLCHCYRRWPCEFFMGTCLQFLSILMVVMTVCVTQQMASNNHNIALLFPFALLIYAFACPGVLSRFLSRHLFVVLGESSFALYMTHHIVFRVLDPRLAEHFSKAESLSLALVIVVTFSICLHYCLDKPFQNFILRWSRVREKVLNSDLVQECVE